MPRFSIVIPTRQRADTLRFSIETALAQTHPDFEVVVQNNGNDQATNDVVAAFASPRIVLRSSPNTLPYSANFEAALTASSGEFVAFIGDDDGMMPDACAIADAVMLEPADSRCLALGATQLRLAEFLARGGAKPPADQSARSCCGHHASLPRSTAAIV